MPTRNTNSDGHRQLKAWTIALAGAKDVAPMAKVLGAVMREHADVRTRTLYIGSAKLAELTGWPERHIKERRSALRDAGWIVDTGEKHGRAVVWRLVIPSGTVTNLVTPDRPPTVTESVTHVSRSTVTDLGTLDGDSTVTNPAAKGDRFQHSRVTDFDTKGDRTCDPNPLRNPQRVPTKRTHEGSVQSTDPWRSEHEPGSTPSEAPTPNGNPFRDPWSETGSVEQAPQGVGHAVDHGQCECGDDPMFRDPFCEDCRFSDRGVGR